MYKIGQWYQYKAHPNHFRKCSQETIKDFHYSEKIVDKIHYYEEDMGNHPFKEGNCIPVDISVVAKYLPEGHPDLLKLNNVIELW
jgi:hypothetical protein